MLSAPLSILGCSCFLAPFPSSPPPGASTPSVSDARRCPPQVPHPTMHISLWVSFIQVVSASGGSCQCPLLNAILDCKPVLSEWYQLLKEAASVHVTVAWISRYLINEARGAFANLWWWEFPPLKYSGQPDEKCQQLPKWRLRGVFVETTFWNLCPVWIWPPHSVRSGQRHRTQNQTQQTNI